VVKPSKGSKTGAICIVTCAFDGPYSTTALARLDFLTVPSANLILENLPNLPYIPRSRASEGEMLVFVAPVSTTISTSLNFFGP